MKNLLLLVLFLISSCGEKKFNQDKSTKVQIVRALNSLRADLALKLIEEEKAISGNDEEVRIYEASAYAIKAGIDIFSIFPILKIKLFNESIINWDNLKKYDNPYMKYVIEEDKKNAKQAKEEKIESADYVDEMEKSVKDQTEISEATPSINGKENQEVEEDNSEDKPSTTEEIKDQLKAAATSIVAPENSFIYSMINDENANEDQSIAGLMKGLWSIYESIPLIVQSPMIDDEAKPYIAKIFKILNDPDFKWEKKKADRTYFISYVAVVMVLSELKHIIDFKQISNPVSLICNMKPIEAGNRYDSTISYLNVAINNISKTALIKGKKNKRKLREQAKNIEKMLLAQKEAGTQSSEKLADQLTILKTNNCM